MSGSNYRPICDTWILARGRTGLYGTYPLGFLHRARELLGVTINDPVLHVCGGLVRKYPYKGLGPNDQTLDINPKMEPDFIHDVQEPLPLQKFMVPMLTDISRERPDYMPWPAILADPPYSEEDAAKYDCGAAAYPPPAALLANCVNAVCVGGRVGILHYQWVRPPKTARCIAIITVLIGFNNKGRLYGVYERES
jgi:hypothetical protein